MANQGYYGGLQNWMDAMSDSIVTARQKKLDAQSALQQEMQMKLQQAQLDKYNQDLASEKALKEAIARAAELQRAPATDTMPGTLPSYASGVPTAVQRPFAPTDPMTQNYLAGLIQQEIGGMAPQPNMPFPAQDVSPLIQAYAQGRRPAGSTVVKQPTGEEIVGNPSVQAAMLANDPKSYLPYMRETNKVDPVTMLLLRDMLGGEQKNMLEDRKDKRLEKTFGQQNDLSDKKFRQTMEMLGIRMDRADSRLNDRKQQSVFVDPTTQQPLVFNPKSGTYEVATTPGGVQPRPVNPSAGEREKTASIADIKNQIGEIEGLYRKNPNYVGIVSGPVGMATAQVNSDEEYFRTLIRNMRDSLLRARSGAQINEQEYKRLSKLVPNYNTTDRNFEGRLKAFNYELDSIMSARGKAQSQGGVTQRGKQPQSGISQGGKPSLDSFFK